MRGVMSPDECRRRASECIALAQRMVNPANKLQLLIIAQAWLNLADRAAVESASVPSLDNVSPLPDDGNPSDPSPSSL